MKQILLMRHAKSSWDNSSVDDFERPLSKRGQNDAPRMGKFLKKSNFIPDLVISSPAQRALETSTLCVQGFGQGGDVIELNKNLYFGSPKDYLSALQGVKSNISRVMIVGHNPLMESFAGSLSGSKESTSFRIPTAAIICLESYAVNWDQITWGTCQVNWMIIPKLIRHL